MAKPYYFALIFVMIVQLQMIALAQEQGSPMTVNWIVTIGSIAGFDYITIDKGLVIAVGMSKAGNNTLSMVAVNSDDGEIVENNTIKLGGVSSIILCIATIGGRLSIVAASDYILYKNITVIEIEGSKTPTTRHMLLEPSVTPYTAYCSENYIYVAGSRVVEPKTRTPYIAKAKVGLQSLEIVGEEVYKDYTNTTVTGLTIIDGYIAASIRPILGAPGKLGPGSKILLVNESTLNLANTYDMGNTATIIGVEPGINGNIIAYGYDAAARGRIVAFNEKLQYPIYTITLETPSIISTVKHYDSLVVGSGVVILGESKTTPILVIYNRSTDNQTMTTAKTYTSNLEGEIIVTSMAIVTPEEYIIAGSKDGDAFIVKLSIPREAKPLPTETTRERGESWVSDPVVLMLTASTVVLAAVAIGLALALYRRSRLSTRVK